MKNSKILKVIKKRPITSIFVITICILACIIIPVLGHMMTKQQEEHELPDDPKDAQVNISEISGYLPESTQEKEEGVKTLTFPYQIPGTNLLLLSIGQYTGPFIETGEDVPVSNVMTILVKNTGEKTVEYGEIQLYAGDEIAVFKATVLPPGTSMMVQELNQIPYSKTTSYLYKTAYVSEMEVEKGMEEDKVHIQAKDGEISVKNLTDETIQQLYICYHSVQKGGVYRGGITYRVRIDDLKPGETKSVVSNHYYVGYSSILFVDIVPEEAL